MALTFLISGNLCNVFPLSALRAAEQIREESCLYGGSRMPAIGCMESRDQVSWHSMAQTFAQISLPFIAGRAKSLLAYAGFNFGLQSPAVRTP